MHKNASPAEAPNRTPLGSLERLAKSQLDFEANNGKGQKRKTEEKIKQQWKEKK